MSKVERVTVDANEAAASVAHRASEVIAIYPITPSSPMGEFADAWSAKGRRNIWGKVPHVVEMQSEGGAAGAAHGALQAGALATTFTSSQGLLLMIPNMYKIAGELTSFTMHVAARTVATHALSIFGDHSDVMACRQTGFALLASGSVQEAQDFAAIAHAASLSSRIPFLHFFDGFRTSHEVAKIEELSDEELAALIDPEEVAAHRRRGLTPDHPVLRGTAQNPDAFFQAREAANPFYLACPEAVARTMEKFAKTTGRRYGLFDYFGDPRATRVVVLMGSGAETAHETVEWLLARGEKVGVLKVRLFRPFDVERFAAALPPTVEAIAVLDRTKEPGSVGEPLYQDVVTALCEANAGQAMPRVVGGRYGLSSKEFTPAMVAAVFDELSRKHPRNHFTVGITDDVTHTSLPWDAELDIEPPDVLRMVFWGLGSDGTVGANRNSIKILGEESEGFAQGYFVYDSKKSGSVTVSHLRFGPRPIRSAYLIRRAHFVACHQFELIRRFDILDQALEDSAFLLNTPYGPDEVWDHLPREAQEQILEKRIRFYVIDAYKIAREAGLKGRINTIMQTCFFSIMQPLPQAAAIARIKKAVEETYAKRGPEVLKRNFAAIDATLAGLAPVRVPGEATSAEGRLPAVPPEAPDFVQRVTAVMIAGQGDRLPVSAFPVDGTWPTGTTRWEKRNIATEIPVWDAAICIQCNKCALVCPHAAIRAKVFEPAFLEGAPATFKSDRFRSADFEGWRYTIQVAPEDCTGCSLCVQFCPAKDKSNPKHKAIDMAPQRPLRDAERENYAFFLDLPEPDRTRIRVMDVKGSQFADPLFEYSGACAGCGETPYIKLLTQLFGDRLLIANATGCTSIYGGNLPTTPYTVNREGRGPAWSNSLFEDNAEFGLGMRLALDSRTAQARLLAGRLAPAIGETLVSEILEADQSSEAGLRAQRERIAALRARLAKAPGSDARDLELLADDLVRKSVWIIGGDGWAYDIGYGGLDHVLSLHHDVNVLVLDTEVYSNTGGQQSKATPLGAAAKFAVAGKEIAKKDLGMMAMSYGHVYVGGIAFGAKDFQTVKAFQEAESYQGPSLLIAYSHCIAHGYDMAFGCEQQKLLVDSGLWPLYRFDPRRIAEGQPPLQLDSGSPKVSIEKFMQNESRFRMIEAADPGRHRHLAALAGREARRRLRLYKHLSEWRMDVETPAAATPPPAAETRTPASAEAAKTS
ncbi:MAG: pyruvate:ferredoxin (flavodoxin) oxidoreductase [Acidobacteriota bacterium]